MRDVDRGDAETSLQSLDPVLHFLPQVLVERAQRLVQKEDAGAGDEDARQRHPLLLAAAELSLVSAFVFVQSDLMERVAHAALDRLPIDLSHAQAEGDVLGHAHVRKNRVVLEHDSDIALLGRTVDDVVAVDQDLPLVRRDEASDHPQGRGFAAARWAEEGEELAGRDLEADPRHRDGAAVGF